MRPKPSRVSAFRNCLGTIWSVSTLTRSSGITLPVCVLNGCIDSVSKYSKIVDFAECGPVGAALRLAAFGAIRREHGVHDPAARLRRVARGHIQQFDFVHLSAA